MRGCTHPAQRQGLRISLVIGSMPALSARLLSPIIFVLRVSVSLSKPATKPATHMVPPGVRLQESAAERITLTSPPEEVSAAATVLQLRPFLNETLLTAAMEEGSWHEEAA